MEGPSLVIAREEFKHLLGQTVQRASGTARLPWPEIRKHKLKGVSSWGKHFLLRIGSLDLRVHFLMFGSYRIGNPRPNRIPKLTLTFAGDEKIYFYSCAIKVLDEKPKDLYDWSLDVMSPKWNPAKASEQIQRRPERLICDVIMDQKIFSGAGNIIKSEVLFNLRLHPEARVADLSKLQIRAVAREVRRYSLQFYRWKKAGILKRNWKIFRKKTCPACTGPVMKRPTGQDQRISHFCPRCQRLLA